MVFLKPAAPVRKDQSSVPCEAVNSGVSPVCAVVEKFTSLGDENLSLNGPTLFPHYAVGSTIMNS